MAVLTDPERISLWSKFMSEESGRQEAISGMTKTELRAAVDAIDDWIESNQSSFNSSLPQPARSSLTARQKVLLFFFVANKRWEVV